ncbi:DUF4142 domain-containing protein [Lichenihabitans psoromatis]|uniref:DUF4142 domain-containing protein n=1 Tax=Lichenihabitans psoromatis TaxID=2528642 RepID=UPI0013F173E6|nr:DUF4142 domain-containing protein [Lichenihabitans psoromatis]
MERRLVLVGIAALAAGPALAQSNPAPATDTPAAAPTAPLAPAPAMKMAPPISLSDAATTHLKRTMAVGSLSLLACRIAAPKVRQAMLKQFVAFETAEQETIASILKAMMMPGAPPSGDVATPTDAELMGAIDAKGKAAIEKLRDMRAGVEFERAYVKAQVEGHRELLEIQETYLKVADNLDATNMAKLAKGQITEHLVLLSDIGKQIG